uniref:Uncharacterized protein n=1 Tax=Aegilops tauschii subsp. strangulata TaxID=200361 RepID=A0A453IGF3_AEGTS
MKSFPGVARSTGISSPWCFPLRAGEGVWFSPRRSHFSPSSSMDWNEKKKLQRHITAAKKVLHEM